MIFVLFLALASCKGNKASNSVIAENAQAVELDYKILLDDEMGPFSEKAERVIDSQAELDEVYAKISENRLPAIEAPKVDFKNELVALVSLGTKTSGGYGVKPTTIKYKKAKTIVSLEVSSPGQISTSVMTAPIVIFSFERREGAVVFGYDQ